MVIIVNRDGKIAVFFFLFKCFTCILINFLKFVDY